MCTRLTCKMYACKHTMCVGWHPSSSAAWAVVTKQRHRDDWRAVLMTQHAHKSTHNSSVMSRFPSLCLFSLSWLACGSKTSLLRLNVPQWVFSPLFNLQQEPLSGIWTNIWICHNPFVCFPFRRLCVHTVSLFQVAMGEMEIYSSNRDDIWSPACFSMLSIAWFPRLQSVEDLIITSSFPLNLLAFFGGWRNSGNSFHWPNQTFRSHGMLFHCVLLLNKALHFQWGKRKRMRGRAKEWNMRKLRRTSGPFLTDIGEGGGVGSLSTLHWVS